MAMAEEHAAEAAATAATEITIRPSLRGSQSKSPAFTRLASYQTPDGLECHDHDTTDEGVPDRRPAPVVALHSRSQAPQRAVIAHCLMLSARPTPVDGSEAAVAMKRESWAAGLVSGGPPGLAVAAA